MPSTVEAEKRAAAARAVDFVRPGMRLGLGTGSTARHFVDLLGERVRMGLDIVAVPNFAAFLRCPQMHLASTSDLASRQIERFKIEHFEPERLSR